VVVGGLTLPLPSRASPALFDWPPPKVDVELEAESRGAGGPLLLLLLLPLALLVVLGLLGEGPVVEVPGLGDGCTFKPVMEAALPKLLAEAVLLFGDFCDLALIRLL